MFSCAGQIMIGLGQAQQVCSTTYQPFTNQDLIEELDKKYLRVDKILKGFLVKRFYNQKSLERLKRFYCSLWWKELRKNGIVDLSQTK